MTGPRTDLATFAKLLQWVIDDLRALVDREADPSLLSGLVREFIGDLDDELARAALLQIEQSA